MKVSIYIVNHMSIADTVLLHPPLYGRDVLPYLSRFIEVGGTYKQVTDTRGGDPVEGIMVSYQGKSVLLTNSNMGSSGVSLLIPNNLDTGFTWETLIVSHEDLDAWVCYWLNVPKSPTSTSG